VGEIRVVPAGFGEPGADALGAFVASTRRWSSVQVPLAPGLSAAFGGVAVADGLVGGWAATVLAAGWPCSGFLCELSTLGGRPTLLLAVTAGCLLVTALLAAVTGGLARAGGGQLTALTLTAAVGVVAAIGAVLALVLVVLAAAAAAALLLALFERS
jgi:hypothetical protein